MRMRLVFAALCFLPLAGFGQQTSRISLEELRDRIRGGWAGQMIGVSFGAPTEFRYNGRIIPKEELPKWSPEKVSNALNQDDLYVDMTLAKVLDDRGLDATTEDFGRMFREAQYSLWHANLAARRNLKRGVPASLSGTMEYNIHGDDIDFQIESDFIGLMAPGMPRASLDIAMRAGRVMNFGEGIYGGVFVSCMYSAAFFEKDPRGVVEAGLRCLPPRSKYAQVIGDVLSWSRAEPGNWEAVWKRLDSKWNRNEPCPEGALRPFNIDAALNGAYIALGLLYGGGDFSRTIEVSTRAGQDSDCNPSSAGGILGVMLGYNRIPEDWKGGIPVLSQEKFRYTDFTFESIVESTQRRAVAMAERNGGSRQGGRSIGEAAGGAARAVGDVEGSRGSERAHRGERFTLEFLRELAAGFPDRAGRHAAVARQRGEGSERGGDIRGDGHRAYGAVSHHLRQGQGERGRARGEGDGLLPR